METTGAGQMANVRADLIGLDVGAPRRHGQVLIVRLVFPTLCAVLCYRIEYRVAVISGVANQNIIDIFLLLRGSIRCSKSQAPRVDAFVCEPTFNLLWRRAPLAHDHSRVVERMIAMVVDRAFIHDQFLGIVSRILGDRWVLEDPVQLDDSLWSTGFPADGAVSFLRRTFFDARYRAA